MSTSSSFELGKRKRDNDNISSDTPLLKKSKVSLASSSLINNRNHFSSPSLICVDYFLPNHITLCINDDKNVFYVGSSVFISQEENIKIPTQINDLLNIKMISCGNCHTILLNYECDVYSFGSNIFGQLGIGKNKNEVKQTFIPQKINLPPCKQVSCGILFTMCVTEDNELYSFGSNNFGELGLGNYNENYNSPQLIPDLDNIEFIICSGNHSICKTYNTEFYSWGHNYYGQLGQGNNDNCNKPIQCLNWPDNIISIKCGDFYSLLLTSEGQVYSFGCNEYGQLGINDKSVHLINIPTSIKDIPEIQRIECGYMHSMCIDINDNLWLFGDNEHGQLGLGDNEYRYKPILHPTLKNIIDISSGGKHTLVKTIDNKIYGFGSNEFSQLGIKTLEGNQLTPIQVFINNEDIWCSTIGKSRQKSARK